MPAQRRPPGGKDKSEGGGSVQSSRGKEINRAVFLRNRMCPAARNTAERGDECAEHVLSRGRSRCLLTPGVVCVAGRGLRSDLGTVGRTQHHFFAQVGKLRPKETSHPRSVPSKIRVQQNSSLSDSLALALQEPASGSHPGLIPQYEETCHQPTQRPAQGRTDMAEPEPTLL